MKMTVRGIIIFGIYIFLITLPLDTALLSNPSRVPKPFIVEIAVCFGFPGFSLMALEFALISRINAAAQPFGEDSLQLFHNIMGVVALGLLLVHPLILIFPVIQGIAGSTPSPAVGILPQRQLHYLYMR